MAIDDSDDKSPGASGRGAASSGTAGSGRETGSSAYGVTEGKGGGEGGPSNKQSTKPLLPVLSLPKGGGAIRGIGEKFSVNAATGTASLSVPLPASPGRNGFGPQVELGYDSGHGNGPFGLGFALSVPTITRKTDKGLPHYYDSAESDEYILSGAEDLVPNRIPSGATDGLKLEVLDRGDHVVQRYRPRIEGLFARIERHSAKADGAVHWEVTTKDNTTHKYGQTADSQIVDPKDPQRIFSWLLEESRDDRGNIVRYEYKAEDGKGVDPTRISERSRFEVQSGSRVFAAKAQRYLKRVRYANFAPGQPTDFLLEMVFDYGEHVGTAPTPTEDVIWPVRIDPFSTNRAGFEVRTYRLCQRVLMFHRLSPSRVPVLVRSTDFGHKPGPAFTYLKTATQFGYLFDGPNGALSEKKAMPTLELAYAEPVLNDQLSVLPPQSLEGLAGGVDGAVKQWVDLDGEGIPGVLIDSDRAWYYKSNAGAGQLMPPRVLSTLPSPGSLEGGVQTLQDLGGDGQMDLVAYVAPLAGYASRTPEGDFEPLRAFQSLPVIDWHDPNLQFIDIDGDGLADLLVSEDHAFVWYRSKAKEGFEPAQRIFHPSDEDKGAAVVFADTTQSIQLADMSGDGLVDIVRVRNGEVCYWPNLGYGRFGAKITLESSPVFAGVDEFDPRRIRFGDVDGSGTSDVLYLGRTGVTLYYNQSGNGLSAATPIASLPVMDSAGHVSVVDLLGQGTASLVWSSPLSRDEGRSVMYVDLMGGVKPHLLRSVVNNLGAETQLTYAPSTKFYLADKAAGIPWLTRLAFPVHVVERVDRVDGISKSHLVSTYSYRHGFFDGVEREFRGFARVEQTDAETFVVGTEDAAFQPPTRLVSWFHTGAWLEKERLEVELAKEYFPPGPKYPLQPGTLLLPDTILTVPAGTPPGRMTIQDEREAARALRGHLLHQELYADDAAIVGPEVAKTPFAVTEQSYEVRLLQTSRGWRHGVFFAFSREVVSIHTERNPTDPRISHELVLDVDEFGNLTRKVEVGYARANAPQPEQQRLWATLHESSYVNHPAEDFYRLGMAFEEETFELTDLPNLPLPGQSLISLPALRMAIDGIDSAHDLPYDATPTGPGLKRRKIDHKQQIYYRNDLTGALPLGQIESLALPFETYQLALTTGLVSEIVQQSGTLSGIPFDPALLLFNPALPVSQGHYVQRAPDTGYWNTSGHLIFDANHFYLPTEAVDPFAQHHFVTFDTFSLLMETTRDPLGNIVRASNDYRFLVPSQLTDPNLNRVAVAFDALGMVVKTAVMGKAGANEGDTLDQPTATMEYDLLRWQVPDATGLRRPAVAHSISRERHGDPNSPMQHAYTYSDGFGRVAMHKVQAEPGDVPGVGFVTARWVGTGRVVFNNKGNPVKHYEPFFSATFEFEDEAVVVQAGVTPIIHYDPLDRVVRTELPNGTESKVEFDAWQQVSSDPNDTVLNSAWYVSRGSPPPNGPEPIGDPERRAAWLTARHAGTPTVTHYDGLGRPFLLVAQNRTYQDDGSFTDAFYETRTELDIKGNALSLIDARQALASQNSPANPKPPAIATFHQRFDVLSRRQRTDSADAGVRVSIADVAGKTIRRWDSRGQIIRNGYDELERQSHLFVQQTVVEHPLQDLTERLLLRTVFGEALDPIVPPGPPPLTPPPPSPAQQLNLRGQPYRLYDCAGLVTSVRFDFKANLLESERRLALDYHVEPNWTPLANLTDPAQVQAAAEPLLEPVSTSPRTVFPTESDYDALNRVTSHTTPDGSIAIPSYNAAGLLEQVTIGVRGGAQQTVIANIDYNARGQRVLYEYQNPLAAGAAISCRISYSYDPFTFRLATILTTRTSDGTNLQDLRYTCDPVGNIVELDDRAVTTPAIFTIEPITGDAFYRFDSLYRLIQAEGREHPGQVGTSTQPSDLDIPVAALPHPNDLQALVRYLEKYSYDPVGNIQNLVHRTTAANGSPGPSQTQWTRTYDYAVDSNQLLRASAPGDAPGAFSETFNPDPHGSMRRTLNLNTIAWDYADRIQHVNKLGGGDVFLTYDASGTRVRKVWEHSGLIEERIYIGGWEIFRRHAGSTLQLERETLHVMDGERRVAMVETKTIDTVDGGTGTSRWRFQLDNHLGSAILELTETGDVISYEEYHPFGSTAFHSAKSGVPVSSRRYRYTGKERDDEIGLYYYGARYYAPWLGRWTAADPAGLVDGPNLFIYARNQPVVLVDPNGRQAAGSFGVNPHVIKRGNYTGAESQAQIRAQYAKLHVYYRGDAAWDQTSHTWFVDRSQRVKGPKGPTPHPAAGGARGSGAGGSGGSGGGAGSGGAQAPRDTGSTPGGTGPAPAPPPESTPPPTAPPAPASDPNRPATAGEAAKAIAVGFIKGAVIGAGLVALGSFGAVLGVGLLGFGLYKLATGGYKDVAASAGRLFSGKGTASDYEGAAAIVGGILGGGVAGGLRGGGGAAEGGTASVESAGAGAEGAEAATAGTTAGEGAGAVGEATAGAKPGTFPAKPSELLPEVPRVTKPSGTQVIQTSENLRIRAEQHPLKPGETFAPRHHGQHYHVEIRLNPAKSWNNPGNVVKVKPPGYVPGQGTGFLPGEPFPGQ